MNKINLLLLSIFLSFDTFAAQRAPAPGMPDGMMYPMFYPGYAYSDCVTCNMYNGQASYPMNQINANNYSAFNGQYNSPWWSQYGALSYPNFHYPSAWANNGVNTQYYAGHGGGFAGKPNVYITAPDKTELKIKVGPSEESNLLLTVPAHGEQGWAVQVKGEKILVDDVEHDFLFYDIRFDEQLFSDTTGFCGDRKIVLEEMMTTLKDLSFKPQELRDFYEYWSVKLPRSNSYCVFPQFNEENEKAYKLSVTSTSKQKMSITRVTFLVAVEESLKGKNYKKFHHSPKDKQGYKEKIKHLNSVEKESIWIREWAVGFTAGK